MAIEDISIRLKMAATGVDQQVENSERIADNYAKAAVNAQKLGATQARAAAFAGSRSPRETVEYGMARGAMGATGASARDFANQAQGLGGLVRLYATYAANVFAVTAAFRALSDAMNTANMVRGLDQLGAASGRALGNLSKQLVEVTDGAISMRDAMTSVAQTSSAGMSSQNILRLGAAAQKASQALGLNMADALNRLSRGITKLEPELLDELGIFIRIDDAAEKYARTLGKTTGSLTEFERRQGFALAVLEQAEDKFGKIKLDTNPYDKLAASLDNLTKKLLDFVNIGLGPVVNFLAQSPAALGAALLGIGTLIVKQALPVLTMYREGLKKTRDASLATASETSGYLAQQQVKQKQIALKAAYELEDEKIAIADAAQKRLEQLQAKSAANINSKVRAILKKPAEDITGEDIAYMDKMAQKNLATNKTLATSYKEIGSALLDAKTAATASINARESLAKAEADYNEKSKRDTQQNLDFRKQLTQASRDDLAVRTAGIVKQEGFFTALKAGFAEIGQQRKSLGVDIPILDPKTGKLTEQTSRVVVGGLKTIETGLAGLRVVGSAVSQVFVGLLSRLGTIGIAASVAVATFEFFNSILSNSEKQTEAYKKSQDLLTGSIKNVGDTLDAIRNKKPDQILSVESIQARANAFNDLSDGIVKASKDFEKLINSQNSWTTGVEAVTRFFGKTLGDYGKLLGEFDISGMALRGISTVSEKLFGKGTQAEFSDKLAETINGALAVAETELQKEKLSEQLRKIFGQDIDLTNLDNLKEKINSLPIGELTSKSQLAAKEIKKISDEANNGASILTSLKGSISTLSREIDGLNTSLLPTDRLGKIGVGFIDTSSNLVKALGDTKNSIVAIKEVASSMQLVSLLPSDIANSLLSDKKRIEDITTQLGEAREAIREYKLELAKLPQSGGTEQQQIQRASLQQNLRNREVQAADLEQKAAAIVNKYSTQLQRVVFEEGINKLNASLKFGMEQAAITSARAYVSALGQLGGATAKEETKLALQELNIQQRLIEAQYQSKLALEKNTAALEMSTTAADIREYNQRAARGAPTEAGEYQRLMEKRETIIQKQKQLEDPSIQKLEKARKDGTEYEKRAAMELGSLTSIMFGKQIQLAQIAGQKAQVLAQGIVTSQREIATEQNKQVDISLRDNQLKLDNLNTNQNLLGLYDSALASQRTNLEAAILQQNAQKEINKLKADEAALDLLKGKDGVNEPKRIVALKLVQQQAADAQRKAIQDEANLRKKARFDEVKAQEEIAKKERDTALQILQANNEISNTRLDASLQYLQVLEAFGVQDKISETQQRTKVELLKQEIQFSAQLIDLNNRQLDIDFKRKQVQMLRAEGIEPGALLKEIDREQALLNAQRDSIIAGNDARKESIRLQAEQNIKLAEQNRFLEQASNLSNILNDNFGATGQRLGQAIDTIAKVTKNIQDGRIAQESWNKRAEEFGDFPPPEFIEEGTRLQKKAAQDELANNALTLNSTKKLFKEKTAAYKAFGALEKAYHIARLIMSAKEIATQIASTVSFVTSSITRQTAAATEAGVLGVKAVINAVSTLPPPFSFAAGAAMTALVAGLLAQIGKSFKGGKGSSAPSAADVAKVQGTGQEYDASGKLVSTGTGVYGDPTAVADSVKTGMNTLNKNFFGLLGSGNSVIVKALKAIDTNTGNTVKALIGEGVSGFAGSTMSRFGTKVGTESNQAWYNLWSGGSTKTEILDAGFEVKGTFDQVTNLTLDSLNNLGEAANGAAIRFFESVKKTEKTKILGITVDKDVDYINNYDAATQALLKAITGTFSSVSTALVAGADAIDGSGQKALDIIKGFDASIRFTTKGLTAEEALQKLTGEVSKKLNALTVAIAPWVTEFVQSGEEYFEAYARIAKGTEVVRDGLYILGETLGNFATTVERVRVEQKLIETAGGLEEFASAVTYFEEKFLTEQEKIALKQTRLIEQLTDGNQDLAKNLGLSKSAFEKLGFGAVDSTYELKALIQSFQVTDDASAVLKAELLKLAPAMYEVYSEVENFNKSLAVENLKLASTLTPLQQSLREILTTASSELEKYRDNGANLLNVVNNTRLKFLAAIRSSFKSAYDERQKEITGTLDALKRVKESFSSLQKELLRGAQSTATPVEKFNILFGEYKQALTDIQSTDTAVADAAKQAFPNLAKEVLQSASELYAGSEMYTKIFDQVSRDVGSASDFIDSQISEQQRLLDELDSKYKPILDSIETNTQTSAQKLEEAYDLWKRAFGDKTQLTAADIETFTNALKDKNTPVVKALADLFKLTDPGTAALAISVEALAVDFEQFARGLVEAAKTSMGELGANSLTAIRAAAVANKPADGGDGGKGGDGGNGGIVTIGADGRVVSTVTANSGNSGVIGNVGTLGAVTTSTVLSTDDGASGAGFLGATEDLASGRAVVDGTDLSQNAGTPEGRALAAALEAAQDAADLGELGINTDLVSAVNNSLSASESLVATTASLASTANSLAVSSEGDAIDANNALLASSNQAITDSVQSVISTIGNANISDIPLLVAHAINDFNTWKNNQLISLAPGLANTLINAVDNGISLIQSAASSAVELAGAVYDSVANTVKSALGIGSVAITDTGLTSVFTADNTSANDFSPWQMGGNSSSSFSSTDIAGGGGKSIDDMLVQINAMAKGGPVTANTPYMVGEIGPELFVPRSSGTIVPNNELGFNNQQIVEKLDQLIQAVSQGAVINVRATKENTECIEQAIINNNNTIRAQTRVGIK